jgi:broad specificity phosphatase PhoE
MVYTSPLRRCLQTTAKMLEVTPREMYIAQARPIPLLVEFDDSIESKGHSTEYLKRHFHGFDWSEFEDYVFDGGDWSSFRYRKGRSKLISDFLRQESTKYPVIAVTHFQVIRALTGMASHNCESFISKDGLKTWQPFIKIGKSPSRQNKARKPRC